MSASHFTVEQYHRLGELGVIGRRTELIRGYVFAKCRRSPLHSSVATHLFHLLRPQIPEGSLMRKGDPLTFADSEPEPDVSIVRGQESDFEESNPRTAALAAKVATTTLATDRELASLYAEAGVEEYWIVAPLERTVEVFRRPVAGVYLETFIVSGAMALACTAIPGVQITLADLFD